MSKMKLKKKLMYVLTFLSLSALQSCSTLEIAHADLSCIDRPLTPLAQRIELQDLASLSDDTFDGLERHIISYQQRIISQCELIKRHNEAHK